MKVVLYHQFLILASQHMNVSFYIMMMIEQEVENVAKLWIEFN